MPVGIPDVISNLIAGLIVAAVSAPLVLLTRRAGPELMERWAHRVQPLTWPFLAGVSLVGSLLSAVIRGNPWPTVIVLGILLVLGTMTALVLQYGPTRIRNFKEFARAHAWQLITVVFFLSTVALYFVDIRPAPVTDNSERIVFVVSLDDPEMLVLRGILDGFEPTLGAKIFLMNVDQSRYVARLDQMVAAGDTKWDLIALDNNKVGLLVEKNLVEPLSNYVTYDSLIPPSTQPALRPLLTVNGTFYFAPFRPNVKIAYYNEPKFKQYGLEPPRTWNELLEVAKIFKENEGVGRVAIQGYPGAASAVTMIEFIMAAGGNPSNLADDGSADALAFLQELEPYLATEFAETNFDTANELLIDEEIYLVSNWTFGVKVVVEDAGKQEIKAYSGWQGPDREFHVLGGDLLAIPNGAPHAEKAVELIELLLTRETQIKLVDRLRWPPMRLDAYEKLPPAVAPYFEAINDAMGLAGARPTVPQWVLIEECLSDAFKQLITDGKSMDSLETHIQCFNEVPSIFDTYQVQSGDTLSVIAQNFGTKIDLLASFNGITNRSGVRAGQILLVPVQ